MKRIFFALVFCSALCFQPATAAIITTPGVAVTENFTTAPTVANWSTKAVTSLALVTPAAVDTHFIANFNATAGMAALASVTGMPPGNGTQARYASEVGNGAGSLITHATGGGYVPLVATLNNATGVALDSLAFTFDYASTSSFGGGPVPGHRVFYSPTGLANSWTLINSLSGLAPPLYTSAYSSQVATISGLSWAAGANMYLAFVDDDYDGITEPGYLLDNFSWTATAVPEPSSVALLSIAGLFSVGLGIRKFRHRN